MGARGFDQAQTAAGPQPHAAGRTELTGPGAVALSEGIFGQHDVCNTIPVCKSFMERIVKDGVLVPVLD